MIRRPSRRRGLSLVELLVVMSIIAVSLALILPGIQRARADARTDQCRNNLRAIGLALHNYHDTHIAFPPGWVAKTKTAADGPFYGWQSMLLPFIEQAPLYTQIDFRVPPFPAADSKTEKRPNLQMKISLYRCPADTTSLDTNPVRGDYGTSNYAGNYGDAALPGSVDAPDKSTGIFWWSSKCRMADIRDGTSSTLAVGERCITSAAGIWPGIRSNQNAGDALADCSPTARLNAVITSFSSRHEGGAHFVLCDGQVRFISNTIDSQDPATGRLGIYQRLANKDDGLPVNEL